MENTSTHFVRAYIKEKIYIKMMVYGGMEVGNGDQKEIHTHTHDRSYVIVVVDIPQNSVINLTLCT